MALRIDLVFRPPLSDVARNLEVLASRGIYEGKARLAQEVEPLVLYALQAEAPVYSGPDPRRAGGRLRESIRSRQLARYSGAVSLEYMAISYAQYVIAGTRPHVILPRVAPVLAFYVADGTLVFARRVQHPGTQPNPFHRRAWEGVAGDVLEVMRRLGREVLALLRTTS